MPSLIPEENRSEIIYLLEQCRLGLISPYEARIQIVAFLPANNDARSLANYAESIVRTEVLRMHSIATQSRMLENREAIARAGYTLKKEWLSANDHRVRPAHRDAHGQVREVNEPFDVGGEKLMHPHDPSGSDKNTVNCRCVSSPVVIKKETTEPKTQN